MTKIPKKIIYVSISIICIVLCGALYVFYPKRAAVELRTVATAPVVTSTPQPPSPVEANVPFKVYITGAVSNPGVYEVHDGARVDDVLQLAGGLTEDADMNRINLAAYVSDTQHILVPRMGEAVDKAPEVAQNDTGLVNINTADANQLMTLPGVGPVTADNIIRYRDEQGAFETIEDLMQVTRIGPKTFENLKEYISVR